MAVAIALVKRAAVVVGDCLNVVRDATSASRRLLAANRMYGGLVLAFSRNPDQRRLVSEIRWTKAHRA